MAKKFDIKEAQTKTKELIAMYRSLKGEDERKVAKIEAKLEEALSYAERILKGDEENVQRH
jgi:hypothetical protein